MVYRLCLAIVLVFCSGCVTTSKVSLFCNKTIDLDKRPLEGTMDVGIRLELFRNWEQNVSKIIISMSGWCEADPSRTMFQYLGDRDDVDKLISGEQWLSLTEDDRGDYILENVLTAFKYSLDGEYEQIDVEVADEQQT